MRKLTSHAVALLLGLWSSAAVAQQWTPFPALPPDGHLAVQPSLDDLQWDEARTCLSTLESAVGADYYAAVVGVTDREGRLTPSANNAVPYADALYEHWRGRLDADDHILVVLGLNNRAVAIHPGQRWANAGFERREITRTIDTSSFKNYARAQNYARALCALAEAVDQRLVRLLERVDQEREAAAVQIGEVRDLLYDADAMYESAAALDPALGEFVERRLQLAEDYLDQATAALEARPVAARRYVASASDELEAAKRAIERMKHYESMLPKWRASIEELRRQVKSRPEAPWYDTEAHLEALEECEDELDARREAIARGERDGLTNRCVAVIGGELQSEDDTHFVMTRILPSIVGVTVLTIFFVLIVIAAVRRRRVERLVESELGAWEDAIGTASERLLDLELEFSLYFDPGRKQWTGDSAQLDQACADEVNRLFLLFSKAKDIYDEARRDVEDAPELFTKPLEEILQRLKSAEVVIETGEQETRRKIFLPLSRSYRVTAIELLEHLSGSYERAAELLEEAHGLIVEVDELRTSISRTSSDVADGIEQRSSHGLPVSHLLTLQDEAEERRRRGLEVDDTDPRTAIVRLRDALERFVEARRIAAVGNEAVARVREELPVRCAALRDRIDEMRDEGWVVREPGFDPDRRLDHATRLGERIIDSVASGLEDDAHETWVAVDADLAELDGQLEATFEARDGVPQRLEALRAAHEQIEERIPKAKSVLKELSKEHAEDAYEREADNLTEFAGIRSQILAGFASAEKAHADQRYLAALEDLSNLEVAIETGARLIGELHDALRRLEEARFLTGEQYADALTARDAISEIRRDALGVDQELAREIEELERSLDELDRAMDAPTPHWVELGARAAGLSTLAADLREETAAEVEKHRRAVEKYADLVWRGDDLHENVKKETRDRPHVGALVRDARDEVARVKPLLDDSSVGGSELAVAVAGAERWIERAEAEWKSELDAIDKAEAKLAAAQARYRQVDGVSYGHGVYADCSDAESLLAAARAAARERNWENVVEYAASARVKIDAENTRAEAAADRKRRAARRAARSYSSSTSSSSSWSSSSASTGFSSGTSSFSSSSWSSSSSSFSGGSSFSSSSGGSSFGSSSGGSSW